MEQGSFDAGIGSMAQALLEEYCGLLAEQLTPRQGDEPHTFPDGFFDELCRAVQGRGFCAEKN